MTVMPNETNQPVVPWWRLLLAALAYTLGTTVIYVFWSRYLRWPALESELALRALHLIPALMCAAIVAYWLGKSTRSHSFLIVLIVSLYVGVTHVLGYYELRFTWTAYTISAVAEGAVLATAVVVMFALRAPALDGLEDGDSSG